MREKVEVYAERVAGVWKVCVWQRCVGDVNVEWVSIEHQLMHANT